MSVSKWAYSSEKCDGDYCIGDCDFCEKADGRFPQGETDMSDYITRQSAREVVQGIDSSFVKYIDEIQKADVVSEKRYKEVQRLYDRSSRWLDCAETLLHMPLTRMDIIRMMFANKKARNLCSRGKRADK